MRVDIGPQALRNLNRPHTMRNLIDLSVRNVINPRPRPPASHDRADRTNEHPIHVEEQPFRLNRHLGLNHRLTHRIPTCTVTAPSFAYRSKSVSYRRSSGVFQIAVQAVATLFGNSPTTSNTA